MENESSAFIEKTALLEPKGRALVLKAHIWAEEKGLGKSGENGKSPLSSGEGAASILIDLNLDAHTVVAGLLIEGSFGESGLEEISALFGKESAALLRGLAKNARVSGKSRTVMEAEAVRNMLFVMTDDYRVLLITLAAKLNFLRAPGSVDGEELKAGAREILAVYAPLAVRLGVSRIKDELEDLSLKVLNRGIYRQIKDLVAAKRAERNEFLSRAQAAIEEAARSAGIGIETSSRAKHFYSIYMKMRRRNKSAPEIFDLFGIRIISGSVEQCYTLLGIAHRIWEPVDGTFKDYIARPKPNGYQSLHTTVTVSGGGILSAEERVLEIQIRTREMHEVAENGVASHWVYKRGRADELVRPGSPGNANGDSESASWYDDMRREIIKKSVYVFTPRGKVVRLPSGATPIDFAYSIHSAVGEHCVAAKADGNIIPLHSALRNTETIEILTSPLARPGVNWLESVKTARARNKIRSYLEKRDEQAAGEKSAPAKKSVTVRRPEPIPQRESPEAPRLVKTGPDAGAMRVTIESEKNMMVRFAGCCRPAPGDAITGFVSRGRGIIIHRKGCFNLANIPGFAEREISAEWDEPENGAQKPGGPAPAKPRRFRVEARFRENLFSEIEGVARKYRGRLIEGRLTEEAGGRLTGFFSASFESQEDFKTAQKKIRNIPGIVKLRLL